MYGIIYKIICLINLKLYIGQTTTTLDRRFYYHTHYCKNRYLKRAMKKHGLENFKIEKICECDTKEILDIMETFYIMKYDSIADSGKGYNMTWGGSNGKHSETALRKMRLSHIGEIRTPESNKKRSETLMGREIYDNTKIKMSDVIWYITDLEGNTEEVYILSKWCKEHDIPKGKMKDRARYGTSYMGYSIKGVYKQKTHKKKRNKNDHYGLEAKNL